MLTDITLEVDLAAVCTRKFSSFSMEFNDSTVSCHIDMLYCIRICMKVNTIPKGQNCNRCLYYRVYKKKRNLGISQEIDIVLKTKDFRGLGI